MHNLSCCSWARGWIMAKAIFFLKNIAISQWIWPLALWTKNSSCWVMAKNLFCEATVTFDHQNLISSSLSPREIQIWANSLKAFFLRCHVHNNGTHKQPKNIIFQVTAIMDTLKKWECLIIIHTNLQIISSTFSKTLADNAVSFDTFDKYKPRFCNLLSIHSGPLQYQPPLSYSSHQLWQVIKGLAALRDGWHSGLDKITTSTPNAMPKPKSQRKQRRSNESSDPMDHQ